MKVLWHSNGPMAPTGYGSQTALFTPLIRDAGHDVAISAFWGVYGRGAEWNDIKVYPADRDYGNEWLPLCAADHGDGDPARVQVITLMDVWTLHDKHIAALPNLASWVPVDHMPAPPMVAAYFERTKATPIAMSRFGVEQLEALGLEPLYVPHGVDTKLMRPVPREAFRDKLNIPHDAFVVGMVAANKGNSPSRKGFPYAFTAFAMFHAQHPDAILYLHTELRGDQRDLNLYQELALAGVPEEAVRVTPQSELYMGIEYEAMALVYSNLDVLLNPALGEGFGIPIIEAQACGTPVIVNDFSAMPELCGAGWRVDGVPLYHEFQSAWWQLPHVGSIVQALDEAYVTAGSLRVQAREFALAYDVDRVMDEYWTPALAHLEARLAPPMLTPRALPAAA